MSDERLAEGAARTGQDLQHSGRQAGVVRQFAEPQRRQGRQRRGLQHHTVAGSQGRRGFPAGDREGEIPRHDAGHHAHGLPHREIKPAARDRNGLAAEFRDCARVVLEDPRPERGFVPGIADRFADVERFKLGNRLDVLAQRARDIE